MASSDSQFDKSQHERPKRAELPDVNINTGAQRASLIWSSYGIHLFDEHEHLMNI